MIRSRLTSVFLNSCLHIMGYSLILVVDMVGKIWRKIPWPRGTLPSIHQAQGHLCVCTVGGVSGHNMSQLSFWILEDYATNKWTLKHTISTLNVFGKPNCWVHKPEVPRGPASKPGLGLGEQPVAHGPAQKV